MVHDSLHAVVDFVQGGSGVLRQYFVDLALGVSQPNYSWAGTGALQTWQNRDGMWAAWCNTE